MAETLSGNTTVVVTPKQISSNLAGEEVIMQLESGIYYGLDSVGASVWALVQQPRTVAAICEAICAEFDVEPERCLADVRQLLTELIDAQLVEVRHGQDETVAPTA